MKKPNIIILSIAIILMGCVFGHDYRYDTPSMPMTIWDYIPEIIFSGTLYTVLFYFIMLGCYKLIAKTFSRS